MFFKRIKHCMSNDRVHRNSNQQRVDLRSPRAKVCFCDGRSFHCTDTRTLNFRERFVEAAYKWDFLNCPALESDALQCELNKRQSSSFRAESPLTPRLVSIRSGANWRLARTQEYSRYSLGRACGSPPTRPQLEAFGEHPWKNILSNGLAGLRCSRLTLSLASCRIPGGRLRNLPPQK